MSHPIHVISQIILIPILIVIYIPLSIVIYIPLSICEGIRQYNNTYTCYTCKFCELGACNCKSVKQPRSQGGKTKPPDVRCYDKNNNILDGIYNSQ